MEAVGLAAPQVGKSKRLIVCEMASLDLPLVQLFNPVLTRLTTDTVLMQGACAPVIDTCAAIV